MSTRIRTIIISDLHLSEGWDPDSLRLSRKEDFFFDDAFGRFLKHLQSSKRDGETVRLIINGDFVDFLQITKMPEKEKVNGEAITKREREYGLGTSPVKTLWKLNVLLHGHGKFFAALGEFLSEGNELVIIPGNHDIEWMIPEVQGAFKRKIAELGGNGEMADRISFSPWFYYDSFVPLYVEHGNQYDSLTSFDYFLSPFREDETLDLPAGSFFGRYLFNRMEVDYPFADNVKPPQKFLWWLLKNPKRWCQLMKYPRFFREILNKAGGVDKVWKGKLQEKQASLLDKLADTSGLGREKIDGLKDLWVPSAIHNKTKRGLFFKFIHSPELGKEYYRHRAREIYRITGARYIVFGHTHEADLFLLTTEEGKRVEYVNSGTWTKSFAADYAKMLLTEEKEFTLVEVRYDAPSSDYKMQLLRWNDAIGDLERVRLFEEKR